MARTQFSFTFTNAQPGASVHFSAPVYADATTRTPDGPTLVLSSSNAVSVWADAGVLIAATVDGNGQPLSATALADNPTVTTDSGTAGTSPFGSGGSSAVAWTAVKTADYAASSGDAVPADASGGNFNVTLPAPTANARVTVKNIGATGTATVLPHATETIDGAASYPLTSQWQSRDFQSDGTNWLVV